MKQYKAKKDHKVVSQSMKRHVSKRCTDNPLKLTSKNKSKVISDENKLIPYTIQALILKRPDYCMSKFFSFMTEFSDKLY